MLEGPPTRTVLVAGCYEIQAHTFCSVPFVINEVSYISAYLPLGAHFVSVDQRGTPRERLATQTIFISHVYKIFLLLEIYL